MNQTRNTHIRIFDCSCGKSFSGTPKQITLLVRMHNKVCSSAQSSGGPIYLGQSESTHKKYAMANIKGIMKNETEFMGHINKYRINSNRTELTSNINVDATQTSEK